MVHQKRSKERGKGKMSNAPHQPFSLAAHLANKDQATHCYQERESSLRTLCFDAHVSRLRCKSQQYSGENTTIILGFTHCPIVLAG